MPLTATKVRTAKSRSKPYKLYDAKGLYLLVTPSGGKLWKLKYTLAKRERSLSMGAYPEVSLALARRKRSIARQMLAEGVDPSRAKKARREAEVARGATFEFVAKEWSENHLPRKEVLRRLELYVYPKIGKTPIREIGPRDLLVALRKIVDRGTIETAHRVKRSCGQVFRYAIATGLADRDITSDLRGALPPTTPRHHPSITDPVEVGGLLRAIEGFTGYEVTKLALKLAPLVFVRPGELRAGEWSEIDLAGHVWRIPAHRMKMMSAHIVPLSTQARSVLEELEKLTGDGKFIYPSIRTRARCMSENTMNAALRRLGYTSNEMTTHGFRSMASTLLNELGWNRDAIERQLAHAERDRIRAAYNYADHLALRQEMMQAWADYLDGLRKGARVLPINRIRQ